MTYQFSDPSRVCVLSGRFPPSGFQSNWNHRAYANKHGYTYINCDWPTGAQNRYMTKLHFVKQYVRHFDYVFWIDDDAFFIDLEKDLSSLVPPAGKIGSFCRSPTNKKIFTYLSSGQFMLEGGETGARFVDAVLATPLDLVKEWWNDDLGMFTNGDQDAIVYLLHESDAYKDCLVLHPYMDFNSRLLDLTENAEKVFLLHFTGSREKKHADHQQAMAFLGTGPALLNDTEESLLLSNRKRETVLAAYPRVNVVHPKGNLAKRIKTEIRRAFNKKQ